MTDPNVVPIRGGSGAAKGSGFGAGRGMGSGSGAGRGSGADPLAAGAARASGERAKRRRTPLLTDASGDEVGPRPVLSPFSPVATGSTAAHRPRPVPKTGRVVTAKGRRTSSSPRTPSSSPRTPSSSPRPAAKPAKPLVSVARVGTSVDEIVTLAIATLRRAAAASGLSGDDIERQVATTLAFVRRRLSGDYAVDDFGFDQDYTENVYLPLLRPLYKSWFRVEVRGIENIPSSGGALIVANHSGTIAFDSLMTQVAVHDEHPAHRFLRMLGADLVFRTPVVGSVARKSGVTLAANPDAERLLASGEVAGVWPEGFKGVGKPFRERYKLQRFGRGGFVAAALRTGAPIVPCAIVGAEEIYPILGNLKTVARIVGAPYIPVTPTFPLLGPLGLIPLPSKWIIEFGSPVETAVLGAQAADDPMVVFDLTDRVRETIQQTLYSLLLQRRSVFF